MSLSRGHNSVIILNGSKETVGEAVGETVVPFQTISRHCQLEEREIDEIIDTKDLLLYPQCMSYNPNGTTRQ